MKNLYWREDDSYGTATAAMRIPTGRVVYLFPECGYHPHSLRGYTLYPEWKRLYSPIGAP